MSVAARAHALGAALAAVYLAALLATAGDLAMARDEGFYAVAAERYGAWLDALARDPAAALRRETVDAAWSYNAEHPPLAKLAFAVSWKLHEATGVFPSDGHAFRFPGMLSAALLLWLVVVFGARATHSVRVGAAAGVALALMPRFAYHAHLDAFDVPIALMVSWVAYAYWRSLVRGRRAWLVGVAFGLALATKHNSWVLPGVFAIHHGWVALGERRRRAAGAPPTAALDLRPWWLLAMVLLGPPILVGLWPWLWHDGLARFAAYARFHLRHDYYNMAYFGENHFLPPFPVSFPLVMTAITVPATTLALAAAGVAVRLRALAPPGLEGLAARIPGPEADPRRTAVLWAGGLAAPLLIIALPSTPIFGGTKHWLTAYPFLALFAGVGLDAAARALEDPLRARVPPAVRHALVAVAVALPIAPALVETARAHPHGLSHYTPLGGGVAGAADLGMNRQFWGFTHGPLAPWIARVLPDGGRVYLCDATAKSWELLQRDGLLPGNVRGTGSIPAADLVLVHHELHFAEVDYQAWVALGTTRPVRVLAYDGVPLVSVYANPRSRRLDLAAASR